MKKLIKWLRRLFKKTMESPQKIQQQIRWMNLTFGGNWQQIPGYLGLVNAGVFNKYANTANFNLNSGYTVKAFMNTLTGEVKFFPASLFEF